MRKSILALGAFVWLTSSLACSLNTDNYPLGRLSVRVLDENNAGVQGVAVDLHRYVQGGTLLWRASSTGSNGIAVLGANDGGVIEGEYFIRLSFITNHVLADGETNNRDVTVVEGDDVVVTFRVVSGGPNPL
jgi:hypothetical protein